MLRARTRPFTASLLLSLLLPIGGLSAETTDTKARDTVQQFMTALRAEDLEALMKTVDVPWFHDGQRIIRDSKELRKQFEQLFAKQEFAGLQFEIKQVVPYHKVRENTEDTERKLLDEVLQGEDYVALLELTHPGKAKEKAVVLVRLRGSKPAVVGVKD